MQPPTYTYICAADLILDLLDVILDFLLVSPHGQYILCHLLLGLLIRLLLEILQILRIEFQLKKEKQKTLTNLAGREKKEMILSLPPTFFRMSSMSSLI